MRRPPGDDPLTRIRAMRHEGTEPERRLWRVLRNRQLAGAKFRRQVWIGPYVADFLCGEARLVVEVDGDTHDDPTSDARRTAALSALGFRVVRIPNREVMDNIRGVTAMIEQALTLPLGCAERAPPSPLQGEGI